MFDAVVLNPPEEYEWGSRLYEDLERRGLKVTHLDLTPFVASLPETSMFVVLWSQRADDNLELPLARGQDIAVVDLDGTIDGAPEGLHEYPCVVFSAELYTNGSDAAPDQWQEVLDDLVALIRPTHPLIPRLALVMDTDPWATAILVRPDLAIACLPPEVTTPTLRWLGTETMIRGQRVAAATVPGPMAVSLLRLRGPPPEGVRPVQTGVPTAGPFEYLSYKITGEEMASSAITEPVDEGLNPVHGLRFPALGAPAWDPSTRRVIGMIAVSDDPDVWWLVPWEQIAAALPELENRTSEPSAQVHADQWTVEDKLGYALYAQAIAKFITHPRTKPPLVISVQGPWGQGKTSLMRMIQERLDNRHPDLQPAGATPPDLRPSALTFRDLLKSLDGDVDLGDVKASEPRTVWFNAWKYQSSEAVWAGLAHAILEQLPARIPSDVEREKFWLKLQLRRIDPASVRADIHRALLSRFLPRVALAGAGALVAILAGVVALAAGADLAALVAPGGVAIAAVQASRDWRQSKRAALERHLEGRYQQYVRQPDYAERMGYLHLVEQDMHRALKLLVPNNGRAVIFIDDLDRCSPAKVGDVLEAINLFLAGDYQNCVFVLGIDAEVVAAAMEVVHTDVIAKLDDRRGELGWQFLDKFVQLPFVIPRLNKGQREAYLQHLLTATPSDTREDAEKEIDAVRAELQTIAAQDGPARVGAISPSVAAAAPDAVRDLAEEAIARGADSFTDSDPEIVAALQYQLSHLSDNPRTIKRAVNLYRFHRIAAWSRAASPLGLQAAPPDLIASSIVAIVRWPRFVRWLQATNDHSTLTERWKDEPELLAYLGTENLDLDLAASCGLW